MMHPHVFLRATPVCLAGALLALVACGYGTPTPPSPAPAAPPPENVLTPADQAAGWKLLFDGKTTAGWRGYRMDSMPSGWQVVEGRLTRVASAGDIMTRDKYRKFAPHAHYGRNAEGYIGLQDHGDRVAFRNIKIRVLP